MNTLTTNTHSNYLKTVHLYFEIGVGYGVTVKFKVITDIWAPPEEPVAHVILL